MMIFREINFTKYFVKMISRNFLEETDYRSIETKFNKDGNYV